MGIQAMAPMQSPKMASSGICRRPSVVGASGKVGGQTHPEAMAATKAWSYYIP